MLRHLPSSKALRAAFTASSTSALSPSATSARTSSLAGLMVSNVLPDLSGHPFAADQQLGRRVFQEFQNRGYFCALRGLFDRWNCCHLSESPVFEFEGIVSSEGGCADSQNSRLRVLNLEFYVNRFDLRIEIERVFPEFAPDAGLFVAAER